MLLAYKKVGSAAGSAAIYLVQENKTRAREWLWSAPGSMTDRLDRED